MFLLIFPTVFLGVLPIIPELLWFFPTGFSKDSPHIIPERFLGEIYCIASPDFSHRGFKELFD